MTPLTATLKIALPHTALLGVAESWLFKHAGDLQWQNICRELGASGITSDRLLSEDGVSIYPAFLSVQIRFASPINSVGLDDELTASSELGRYGRGIFEGTTSYNCCKNTITLRLLNTFVGKEGNALRPVLPRALRSCKAGNLTDIPSLLKHTRQLRNPDREFYRFQGAELSLNNGNFCHSGQYSPSPYIDFNSVGLLYFANFPAIADTVERLLVHQHAPELVERDWALETATVARDIYFHRNMELGDNILVETSTLHSTQNQAMTHIMMRRQSDNELMADVFTKKRRLQARQ